MKKRNRGILSFFALLADVLHHGYACVGSKCRLDGSGWYI